MLQITRLCDYGLRGVLYLALQPEGRAVPLREVAGAAEVSHHYLSKIFQLLVHAGIVKVRRGKLGGYCLALPAEKLTPRMVVEALDGPLELNECLNRRLPCPKRSACPYYPMWHQARRALQNILDGYSYARLTRRPRRLGGK